MQEEKITCKRYSENEIFKVIGMYLKVESIMLYHTNTVNREIDSRIRCLNPKKQVYTNCVIGNTVVKVFHTDCDMIKL